ncbi:MAG: hypothetical protein ABJA98_15290 [Acidobacteriota bacterium]
MTKRITLLSCLMTLMMVPGLASAGPAGQRPRRPDVHREWSIAARVRHRALSDVRRVRTLERSGRRWLWSGQAAIRDGIRREYRQALRGARRASRAVLRRLS